MAVVWKWIALLLCTAEAFRPANPRAWTRLLPPSPALPRRTGPLGWSLTPEAGENKPAEASTGAKARPARLLAAGVSLMLQTLGVCGPLSAQAAPPPSVSFEEVSRLQDKAFSLTNRFNFAEVRRHGERLNSAMISLMCQSGHVMIG